jgi:hypothetical protein
MGHDRTIPRIIKSLSGCQQVVLTYHPRHKVKRTYCFSRLRGLALEYCDRFDLRRFALP